MSSGDIYDFVFELICFEYTMLFLRIVVMVQRLEIFLEIVSLF